MAKSGYYCGDIEKVYQARVDFVLDTYYYDIYTRDAEASFMELNKDVK